MTPATSLDQISGSAWTFGDAVDTDLLAPGHAMKKPLEQLAQHCLEAIEPGFAQAVQRGDVIVAGKGFGMGSSREQAAQALAFLGVGAVLAKSVARIFYRNALNIGLPVLVCPEADRIRRGDRLTVEPATGVVTNHTTGEQYRCEPIPEFLMAMLRDGGLIPHLHRRLHGTPPAGTP